MGTEPSCVWSETNMKNRIDPRRCAQWLLIGTLAACAARRPVDTDYIWNDASVATGIGGSPAQVLETYASNLDHATRADALEVLVRVASEPGGGRHGVAAIWDPEPWVQRAAVRSLASRTADPVAVEHLETLSARPEVDPYVRCRAALLLTGDLSEDVAESIRVGWVGAPLWRALPCATAAAVHGSGDALVVVQQALSTGSVALDPEFLQTLGQQSLDGIDGALVDGLSTADELARPALVAALLYRGHTVAFEQLRNGLEDADPLVRMEAVLMLASVDRPETLTLLGRAALQGDAPEARVAALVVAAREGSAFRVFEEAWASDNRDVRRAAIEHGAEHVLRQESTSSRSARKRLEVLLAAALVDDDPSTRTEALKQVGRTRLTSLQPVVEALMNDTEATDEARIAAAEALLRLRVGA